MRRLLLIAGTVTFAVWVALAAFLHGNPDPAAIGLAGMLVMIWCVGEDTRRTSVEADVYADAIAALREQYATTDMTTDEFEEALWALLHPAPPAYEPLAADEWSHRQWKYGHTFGCECGECAARARAAAAAIAIAEGMRTEGEWR